MDTKKQKQQQAQQEQKQKDVIAIYAFSRLPFIFSLFFISLCFYLLSLMYFNNDDFLFQQKPVILIPDTMEPISGVLVNTSAAGTVDHPTINGGVINITYHLSGKDEQRFLTKQSKKSKQSQQFTLKRMPALQPLYSKSLQGNNFSQRSQKQEPFADDWANSKKVKQLLMMAASQGKLNYVLKKTEQMKLPASVAIVPMVESNYQINALSPQGAAGAWQLMPSVAQDYGIKTQERFQFTTSTDTALKLLNHLHQQFGNWELAFAAYSAGSQRVVTALRKNPTAKTIDALDLPQETKTYVKRIRGLNETLKELASHAT